MMDLFKDIIPSLTTNQNYVLNSPEAVKEYTPYVVNKALSFHVDCILYANEMNCLPNADKKMHYDYLFNTIKRYKRAYSPWIKKVKDEDVEVVRQYYACSSNEARYYMTLLTSDQIDIMKRRMGVHGKTITRK